MFERGCKFNFCEFLGAYRCSHVANNAQGMRGKMPKNKFVLPIESSIFTSSNFLFIFAWFYMM
jgi:hypothetical protein